jgi:Spy/CpxP family protein refolding chaperone
MKKYLAALTIIGFLFLTAAGSAQQPPAKPEKPAKPGPGPQGPLANLKDLLKLTPEQEAKLKDMQKSRQAEMKAFRDEMQKLRGELNPLLRDPKADRNKINGLIDQISKLNADRIKKSLADRNPLQKILTQEQLDKLNQVRGRMMRQGMMMRGRGMGMGRGMGIAMDRGQLIQRGRFMGPRGQQFMGPGQRGFLGRGMMGPGQGRSRRLMRRPGMWPGWWR